MMFRRTASAIALFAAMCLLSGMAVAKESDMIVRAGLATKDDYGKYTIYKDTTTIPFVSMTSDPNYNFGVVASSVSGKKFICRFVLYIPKQDSVHARDDYSQSRMDKQEAAENYSVVKIKELRANSCEVFLRLDDDDVPGQYVVEVYVDGNLVRKVQFDVEKK